MPDERTCRTCWHWGVIGPGQGLCGHPDTGGAVHGADDTCCNHLATVGRGGDWQPYQEMSNSSTPPEEHVGRHLLTGGLRPEDVEPDLPVEELHLPATDKLQLLCEAEMANKHVAELEANVADARSNADILQGGMNKWRDEYCVERKRVAELEAALKLERGAVEILGVELETRSGICACDVQDGWEQHRGGNTVGACWAAWARERALDAESGE